MKKANIGTLQIAEDPGALAEEAATYLQRAIEGAIRERGRALVGFSGGETPRPAYQRLASLPVDWGKVHAFWIDERYVPESSPRSNYGTAYRDWIHRISIPKEHLYPMPMPGDGREHEASAIVYEAKLREIAGASESAPPEDIVLDVALMGIGDDGHTASLFPGSFALNVRDRAVLAIPAEASREARTTLSFPVLESVRKMLILCQGAGKRAMIEAARGEGEIPARGLQRVRGEVVWLVDKEAAPSVGR